MTVVIFLNRLLQLQYPGVFHWLLFALLLAGCNLPSKPQATATAPVPGPSSVLTETALPATPAATELPIQQAAPFQGIIIENRKPDQGFDLPVQSGVDWARYYLFFWDAIEPVRTEPPTYHWEAVNEASLLKASSAGIENIAIVLYAPFWAQKYQGTICGPISAAAFEPFGQFLAALVNRYSQPPYNVHYWEIGNEPDVDRSLVPKNSDFGCWGEKDDPDYGGGYYGEMLKVVYPQAKAADPSAQIMVGGPQLDCDPLNPPETSPGSGQLRDCTSSRFLEGILKSGAGASFDSLSFHAYDYYSGTYGIYGNDNWHSSSLTTGPVLSAKVRYLRDLLQRFGYEKKELVYNEFALLCGNTGNEGFCLTEDFTRTKADYLAEAYAAALAEGLKANVWYSWQGWRGSGLEASSSEPAPAFQAFQFSAEQLKGVAYRRAIGDFPGVMGYEFQKDGARVWLVWSLDGNNHSILLPGVPVKVYDVFGNPLMASQELSITLAPVYVEFPP